MRSKFKWIFTLLVALTMQFSFAQEKTVTGVVSDELGPVVGANVVVKGTSNGTTTDFDGNYSIKAKKGDVIEVSYVGMKEVITVGDANVYNVALAMQLDAVEVVGALGIKRKADEVTSSYTLVKNDEITQAAAPSAAQALIGKVSGLVITNTSNSVNGNYRIVLNGNRSITGNNEALIVIDNAISTATVFQSLPPEIIETVNVIKGAQGAVLYGEAGSNGVIIVTTRKGSSDEKLTVTLSSAIDFQSVSYLPERQTRYGAGYSGAYSSIENMSWGPEANGQIVPVGFPQADGSYIMAPYTGDEDNVREFFQTGTWLQNGVTVSAGSLEKGYATMSINRQDRDFVIKGDNFKRTNFSLRAGKQVGKVTVSGNASYYSQVQRSAYNGYNSVADGIAYGTLYESLFQASTTTPIALFENSGNDGRWTAYSPNPYWIRDNNRQNVTRDFFNGGLSFKYDFNEHINVVWNPNVQLTVTGNTISFAEYDDLYGYQTISQRSYFYDGSSTARNIYSDILLNFDYQLTETLGLKANIGNNIRDIYTKANNVGGYDFNTAGSFYNYDNILTPFTTSQTSNDWTRWKSASVFANVDLSFKDYLFLNVAGRNDWNSKLAKGNNSYFYPGVGLSFVPTKAFDLNGSFLNYAKVYASYTATGNASSVGAYAIDPIATIPSGFPMNGLAAYASNTSPTSANIKPERNFTRDIGLSLGFFNNRLTFDGQYYYTETKDLITQASASYASGVASALINVGELHNTGFNLDLGYTIVKGRDGSFEWSGKTNFSHYKTVVDKVSDSATEVNLSGGTSTGIYAVAGEAFPMIKAIDYMRDDEGHVIINTTTGNPTLTSAPVKMGQATPDYIVGLTNSFSWKGIKLTVVADYRHGGKILSYTNNTLSQMGLLPETADGGRAGGFIFPNSVVDTDGDGIYETNTSVVSGGNSYDTYSSFIQSYARTASNMVLDASAIKLREVSLSYGLPEKLLKGTGITAATFGVNAKNLLTWLPKQNKYYTDPEASDSQYSGSNGNGLGISSTSNYPMTRSYGFTLNLTF
jgi:TonB-linked SusC/RagA family outer membrane protein